MHTYNPTPVLVILSAVLTVVVLMSLWIVFADWRNRKTSEGNNMAIPNNLTAGLAGMSPLDIYKTPGFPSPSDLGQYPNPINSYQTAKSMLFSRLTYSLNMDSAPQYNAPKFDFLEVHVPPAGDVMIFLVHGEQEMVLRDDRNLYPSDKLIAQLRMING